jgi:hypothetical protein
MTISFTAELSEKALAVVAIPILLPFAEPNLISGYELLVPIFILPDRFNDELIVVALFNVVFPDTFKDDIHVVILFNVVFPETFNDDTHVVTLFNITLPITFKLLKAVVFCDSLILPPLGCKSKI